MKKLLLSLSLFSFLATNCAYLDIKKGATDIVKEHFFQLVCKICETAIDKKSDFQFCLKKAVEKIEKELKLLLLEEDYIRSGIIEKLQPLKDLELTDVDMDIIRLIYNEQTKNRYVYDYADYTKIAQFLANKTK